MNIMGNFDILQSTVSSIFKANKDWYKRSLPETILGNWKLMIVRYQILLVWKACSDYWTRRCLMWLLGW